MDNIESLREDLLQIEGDLKREEKDLTPPVVQEVILARRHVEDARMRLAIALHMED